MHAHGMTHADLVRIAERWLMGTAKCSFAFKELVCVATSEIPDAIGFRNGHSILVECKASRADFLADKKKYFRQHPHRGMGSYRFMMAPEGIIKPHELPERWGLIVVNGNGRCRMVHGPKGNSWTSRGNEAHYHTKRNLLAEMGLMASALRRLHIRGVLPMIYDNPFANATPPESHPRHTAPAPEQPELSF